MKGKFISFEGSEGSGKSTQAKLLARYLTKKGCRVVLLREPGGTKVSEKIRRILLDNKNIAISAGCEALLYMAGRAQVTREVIRPALAAGKIVISDRFLDSTLAYQGYGLGLDLKAIKYIGNFATRKIKPDLTILLELPVRKGLEYRRNSEDRIERRPLGYHLKVRRGYLALARLEPKRIKIIRVDKNKAVTQSRIRELVEVVLLK